MTPRDGTWADVRVGDLVRGKDGLPWKVVYFADGKVTVERDRLFSFTPAMSAPVRYVSMSEPAPEPDLLVPPAPTGNMQVVVPITGDKDTDEAIRVLHDILGPVEIIKHVDHLEIGRRAA